jgi:predicted GNAT family acetyltransferase
MVRTQHSTLVKEFMTDAGGEYKSLDLRDKFKQMGILNRTSVPHMHQQNGRAERLNRTLIEKAQAMRFEACLPQSWWEFAVEYAFHVYNRTPIRRLKWRTPYEALNSVKPDISHLRVLGCGAYVFIPEDVRVNKLAPRAELMTFIGYTNGTKGFKFVRKPNNNIFQAVVATFDEYLFPLCPDFRSQGHTRVGANHPNTEDNIPSEDGFSDDDGAYPYIYIYVCHQEVEVETSLQVDHW